MCTLPNVKFPPDKLIALTISGSEQSDWIWKLCHVLLLRPDRQWCLRALTVNNGSVDNYAGRRFTMITCYCTLPPVQADPTRNAVVSGEKGSICQARLGIRSPEDRGTTLDTRHRM